MSDDRIPEYNAHEIEEKWQKRWADENLFATEQDPSKPKKYVLEMFPYPSGDLHMGHARNYAIGDAMARQAHMKGFEVLHPIGFDAFGLPAENAAIKHNTHPAKWTYANMDTATKTMKRMGFSYDYSRMVETCNSDYYKWGQWIFLKMWERGLVERRNSPVNWCPTCNTVLANEQVTEGKCWRCGSTPEKRELTQWYFKITDYAQELLDGLDDLPGWPSRVKQMQRNWIGRSEGAEVDFVLADEDGNSTDTKITVFTTRPDTLYGTTFFLLAPEYSMVDELVRGTEYEAEVNKVKEIAQNTSSIDRASASAEKHGAFTGRYVINPINGVKLPIWVADYVLTDYGTGAVMGVPSGDQRDFDFARKYGLDVPPVVIQKDDPLYEKLKDEQNMVLSNVEWDSAMDAEGYLVQSGPFTGMKGGHDSEAVDAIIKFLEDKGIGHKTVNFRLRDWLISRQRYWGNPIPAIHCDKCGIVPVPESDLPVKLPENINLAAGETLAECPEFYETTCPHCGGPAKRETDTMDTFTDSSWYFLRYIDPHNDCEAVSSKAANKWMPVDNYIGGIEHAIMHLLYSRFYTRFLRDLGVLDFSEPFTNLLCQGMVKDENGEVMSKSLGNVVPPSSVIDPYGADTMRMSVLFIAPPEKDFDWDPKAVAGCNRFLKRAWRFVYELAFIAHDAGVNREEVPGATEFDMDSLSDADKELIQQLNKLGSLAEADFEAGQYNTAIARSMELSNAIGTYFQDTSEKNPKVAYRAAHDLVCMLSPICPHWADELGESALDMKNSFYDEPWPSFDISLALKDEIEIAVQVLGKIRARIKVSKDASEDELKDAAKAAVSDHLCGKEIIKIVVVPSKLVNIVAK